MTTQIELRRSVALVMLITAMSVLAIGSIALAGLPANAKAALVTGVLVGMDGPSGKDAGHCPACD